MTTKMTRSQWIVETMSRAVAGELNGAPGESDARWGMRVRNYLADRIEIAADALVKRGYLEVDEEGADADTVGVSHEIQRESREILRRGRDATV